MYGTEKSKTSNKVVVFCTGAMGENCKFAWSTSELFLFRTF